jgi:hypothetical protein
MKQEKALQQYKLINDETIKDIFICDGQGGNRNADTASIWLFTNSVSSELKGLGSDIKISLINHNSVTFAKIDAKNFDLLVVANKDSAVELEILYSYGVGEFRLVARGYNCPNLLNVFRKYFSKYLAPGDVGGMALVD